MNKSQKFIIVVGVAAIIFVCLNPVTEVRTTRSYSGSSSKILDSYRCISMDHTILLSVALAGGTEALAFAFKSRKE